MLASPPDAQGLRSLGGAFAARCRRPPRRCLEPALLWVVERTARLDRPGSPLRGHCGRGGRLRRAAAPGARAGCGGGALAPHRARHVDRDLGDLVDRARPLLGLPQPRPRLPRPDFRGRGRGVVRAAGGVHVGLRPRRGARAAARLGAADEGVPRGRFGVGAGRAIERAGRLLERARAALRDGVAARALAGGPARACPLATCVGGGLRLRARRRADLDLLARRRARRGCRGPPLDRAREPARGERCGAPAGRRRRSRGRGLGVLAARSRG